MIAGNKYDGLMVDIWSCGIILYALLCGCLPFEDLNTSLLYKKILSGDYQIPGFLSPQAKDFIQRILTTNPSERMNIQQMQAHPWFNLYYRAY